MYTSGMKPSRRDLGILLPFLAAASASAQSTPQTSNTWKFEDLPLKGKTRAVFVGKTHGGFEVELHETELAPGDAPHDSHRHVNEEMILVRQGTMEVTINGKSSRIGPGGVGFVASNELHGWKNVGADRAHYFVLALRGNKA